MYNTDASPVITNSILWGDGPNGVVDSSGASSTITFSIVKGGFAGAGNLDIDASFVDPVNEDLRLRPLSPAIDAGTSPVPPTMAPTTVDINGVIRPQGPEVDMGAYEFIPCEFEEEWVGFVVAFGLNEDGVNAVGHVIPEKWGLAMVSRVLCDDTHPQYGATLEAYEGNLALLAEEALWPTLEPYQHVIAALLLISQGRQNYWLDFLGLGGVYEVVRRGPGKTPEEPYSDDGDVDGDGISNAVEYESTVAQGGDVEDFMEAVFDPGIPNALMPLSTWHAWLAAALLLSIGVVSLRKRTTAMHRRPRRRKQFV